MSDGWELDFSFNRQKELLDEGDIVCIMSDTATNMFGIIMATSPLGFTGQLSRINKHQRIYVIKRFASDNMRDLINVMKDEAMIYLISS